VLSNTNLDLTLIHVCREVRDNDLVSGRGHAWGASAFGSRGSIGGDTGTSSSDSSRVSEKLATNVAAGVATPGSLVFGNDLNKGLIQPTARRFPMAVYAQRQDPCPWDSYWRDRGGLGGGERKKGELLCTAPRPR
jgi:hypothetical protein